MKILGKRILIEPVKALTSAGGIVLPDNATQHSMEGTIVAIGSAITETLPYTKGSRVFVEMFKMTPLQAFGVNGKEMFLVNQDDICGVMIASAFHPVGDRILLKPIKTVARDSKIIRPSAYDHDAESLINCTVHLLGVGIKNKRGEIRPFSVKVGDEVLVKPFIGRDVDAAEGVYKLVCQNDISAIIETPINPKWKSAKYKIISLIQPPIHIGSPPKQLN